MEHKFGGKTNHLRGQAMFDLKKVGKRTLEWDMNGWKWDGDIFKATQLKFVPLDCENDGKELEGEILIQQADDKEEEACASGKACGSEGGGIGSNFGGLQIQWSAVDGRHDVDALPLED